MRLSKREIADIAKLREILEACKTVRIACVDDQGLFIVPMSFGFELDDETRRLSLWLHSAGEGRKAAAWKSADDAGCPVAIEMDIEDGVISGEHACDYSFAYRSIMGTGTLHPVTSGEDKVYGLDLIMEHLAPDAPTAYGPGIIDRAHVWRIDVDEFTGKARTHR